MKGLQSSDFNFATNGTTTKIKHWTVSLYLHIAVLLSTLIYRYPALCIFVNISHFLVMRFDLRRATGSATFTAGIIEQFVHLFILNTRLILSQCSMWYCSMLMHCSIWYSSLLVHCSMWYFSMLMPFKMNPRTKRAHNG
jgi:hypothetical protein